MERVSVTDLYQASYFLLSGAQLESIQCIPAGRDVLCHLVFEGSGLTELQNDYFSKSAVVNLFSFRSAYSQVSSYVASAKRTYKKGGQV